MSDYVLSASLELKDKFTPTIKSATSEFKRMGGIIGSAVDNVKKKFKEMNLSANDIKGMQKSFNNFVKNTGIGLLTGSGALGAFLKSSYMGFVELDEQLVRNSAITSATVEEQAKLKKQVNELGASTKFTAIEVAKAQMYQAMAGYKTNEILEVTPTLLKLAIATGEDLAATSDMVTDNLSSFGLELQDVGMFADTLANVANNTNTTVGMLGNAFVKIAGTSRTMEGNFQEVATMLGILADNGIKGEMAGTALNSIYAKLAKITPEMRKQFELTNTKLYDQNGKFKGLRKIIEESKPALAKLTEEQRNNWLATIVGTENLKTWTAIMNNSTESTKKAEKAAYYATGALDKFTETMSKTDRQKIDELSSAFDGFKTKLGEALSPIILENVEKLTNYLNDLTNSDELSTENITKFFDEVTSKAKWAAAGFLAAQIAFLGMRASVGDPVAIGQLGMLAAAGVGLGIYAGLVHSEEVNKNPNKSNLENGASYTKQNKKQVEYEYAFNRYNTTGATSTSYGAMQQLNYENAKKQAELENKLMYPDLSERLDKIYKKNFSNKSDFIQSGNNSLQDFNFNVDINVKGLEDVHGKEIFEKASEKAFDDIIETFKSTNAKLELRQ